MTELLLPPGSRLVHIGPHKTGSTSLQVALARVHDQLPEYGAFSPSGPYYRRRRAGWALGLDGRPSETQPPPIEFWDKLASEVRAAGDMRVCVSDEAFGHADPEQARKIVTDLGDRSVHVVAVVRRLDRYLPSLWQERVKAKEARTFDEWLQVALHGDDSSWDHRNVWSGHDVEALVRRWTDVVGPERFTLIVSDDSDRSLIPHTFERMLGLPDGLLQAGDDRGDPDNRSLNAVETELVRQINAIVVPQGVRGPRYRELIRRGLTESVLGSAGALAGPRIPLPGWALDEVRTLSDRRADAVKAMSVRVIGDPDRLRVPADVVAGDQDFSTAQVPLDAVTTAVGATLTAMIEEIARNVATEEEAARRGDGATVGSGLRRVLSRARRARGPVS